MTELKSMFSAICPMSNEVRGGCILAVLRNIVVVETEYRPWDLGYSCDYRLSVEHLSMCVVCVLCVFVLALKTVQISAQCVVLVLRTRYVPSSNASDRGEAFHGLKHLQYPKYVTFVFVRVVQLTSAKPPSGRLWSRQTGLIDRRYTAYWPRSRSKKALPCTPD